MNELVKPNLLDVAGVAEYANISVRQVRGLVAKRALPVIKIGKHVRIAQSDIDTFLRANTREAREL
jgi:excisionase family DNA binding protein